MLWKSGYLLRNSSQSRDQARSDLEIQDGEIVQDWIAGQTVPELKEFWEAEFLENSDEFAEGWVYWGKCAGQGSQSGGAASGPSGTAGSRCPDVVDRPNAPLGTDQRRTPLPVGEIEVPGPPRR